MVSYSILCGCKKIGIYGGSYGGYLTALGLARDSKLFAAGVDIHGVHDWANQLKVEPLADEFHKAPDAEWAASLSFRSSPFLLLQLGLLRYSLFMRMMIAMLRLIRVLIWSIDS